MAQTFRSILSAIIGSVITVFFAWLTLRTQVINQKIDRNTFDKEKAEIKKDIEKEEIIRKQEDARLEKYIDYEKVFSIEERDKLEKRYIQNIEDIKIYLREIKTDIRDLQIKTNGIKPTSYTIDQPLKLLFLTDIQDTLIF